MERSRIVDRLESIVLAVFLLTVGASNAQTVSSSPYYATPSWDQKLQCDTQATCPRFIVLSNWNNAAALDRETGLVWERSPLAPCVNRPPFICPAPEDGRRNWVQARARCIQQVTAGNRGGWRLPSVQELRSLIDYDPSNTGSPRLPPGHPFSGVQSDAYWSATNDQDPAGGGAMHIVDFANPPSRSGACVPGSPDLAGNEVLRPLRLRRAGVRSYRTPIATSVQVRLLEKISAIGGLDRHAKDVACSCDRERDFDAC